MTDFIQIKKDDILRIGIKDANGIETGEHLEFDLEDIDLPLRINECEIRHKKNPVGNDRIFCAFFLNINCFLQGLPGCVRPV